jgi:hypothetical protein
MNWIQFAQRKPDEEPKRDLLLRLGNGDYAVYSSSSCARWDNNVSYWSEIEPPPKPATTCPTCGAFGLPVEPPPNPPMSEEEFRSALKRIDKFEDALPTLEQVQAIYALDKIEPPPKPHINRFVEWYQKERVRLVTLKFDDCNGVVWNEGFKQGKAEVIENELRTAEINHPLDQQLLEAVPSVICPGCGNEIDPEVCHCGEIRSMHGPERGHSFVPAGCTCGYAKQPVKPDPFEEWWKRVHITDALSLKEVASVGWDAAIKHAKGEG